MNNIIYIGSTNVDNVFHVGMTSNNRSPLSRWKDADYRGKLPYLPSRVEFYSVGDLRDEPIHSYIIKDSHIINLHDEGISSDEIFRVDGVDNPVEYIQSLVEEAIQYNKTGIRPIEKFFTPRPHQKQVNDKILDKFDGSQTIIQPLNLCARFGKTLCGLDLFKRSGLDVMIVGSYWLSANQSFISTIESKFDITSDVTIIKPTYQEFSKAIATGNRVLIDLSLHNDNIDIDLIDVLSQTSSLIYIDEADFGAWTESSRSIANQYIQAGTNLVCIATGTNIDRALIGCSQDIEYPITVSYLDLIEAKPNHESLSDIVEVACLNLDANELLIDELNELSEESCPNMAKIFSKRNNHLGKSILQSLFDSETGEDIFNLYGERYGQIEHPAVMMFIPGTKADVNNLVKIGKSFNSNINWIALHGDNLTNREAEAKVLETIQSGGDRTVIISCSMGARSFSVPNIISVVNCKDGGSLGAAVQQASRAFTPGCDKTHGLIVNYSFNPERSSTFETDLISSALDYDTQDVESAVRRVYGLVNFLRKDEYGYLSLVEENDFLTYITSTENLNNMASAVIDIPGIINNLDLISLLDGVDTSSVNEEWAGVINKAKTFIQTETREKGEVDPDKKAIRDLIKKIHRIVDTTGNTFYLSPSSTTFEDSLKVIAANDDKNDEYYNLVGVSAQVVLNDIIQFLPTKFMNMIVTKTSKLQVHDRFDFQHSSHQEGLFSL